MNLRYKSAIAAVVVSGMAFAQGESCADDLGFPLENYRRGRTILDVVYADLDRDGDDDLVCVVGALGIRPRVAVVRNDRNGLWVNRDITGQLQTGDEIITFDMNRDGIPDFAVLQGGDAGDVILFVGNEDVSLEPGVIVSAGERIGLLRAADVDGDEDDDLFGFDKDAGVVRIFQNDDGVFTPLDAFEISGEIERALVADMTGDGAADLVVPGDDPDAITVWVGNGSGGFTQGPQFLYDGGSSEFQLTDWDRDGDLDLVRFASPAETSGPFTLQINANDGTGTLTELDRVPLPGEPVRMLKPADFDRDGDSDVGFTFDELGAFQMDRDLGAIVVNDGDGLARVVRIQTRWPDGWCDADGDGDLDLFQNRPLSGLGIVEQVAPEEFRGIPRYPAGIAVGVATGHFVGDEALDVVTIAEAITVLFWEGSSSGELTLGYELMLGELPREIVVGDLDADGLDDLIISTRITSNQLLVIGLDETGTLAVKQSIGFNGSLFNLDVVDLEPDGDLDVLAWGPSTGISVFRNNGSGELGSGELLIGQPSGLFDSGDLDGDGDADIVIDRSSDLLLYTNDGSGGFTVTATLGQNFAIDHVFLHDIDVDGDLDILSIDRFSQNILIYRNGNGDQAGFSEPPLRLGFVGFAETLAIGDSNGDGLPDIAAVREGDSSSRVGRSNTELFLNDGAGSFFPSLSIGDEAWPTDIVMGDLNADGKDDLIISDITIGLSVHTTSCPGFDPCHLADYAEPYMVLDLADISAYVTDFIDFRPRADLTRDGILDLADIIVFVTLFSDGCP